MNLVFISDKVCWPDYSSPTGYATVGGFPFQMNAISHLFDQTRIIIMERKLPAPPNLMPLTGNNLSVHPLKEPPGVNWTRKIFIILWMFLNGGTLWREIRGADALHINVPGDIGEIAILMGLLQKKRMFIRHCGTWGKHFTLANRILHWLLEKTANEITNLVMATGWDEQPPSKRNRFITWIFSTSLSNEDMRVLSKQYSWQPGQKLELVSVGRLNFQKNVQSTIMAMPQIMKIRPDVRLRIVGDGPYEGDLKRLVIKNKLENIIEFTGNLDHENVLRTLRDSHIFIFPTFNEGFPKALLEAMASRLPVVATHVSVIPHLLKNGCGILLQDPTPDQIAQAVLHITSDPAGMERMGELARQEAQGYTLETWGRVIQMHLEKAWGPLRSAVEE